MIAPAHPFFSGLRPPLAIAHRGGAAVAPENTLAAFHAARERHGADLFETDVQATADGELVLLHDATLGRTTNGRGPVAEHTWAQVARLDAAYHFSPDRGRTHPLRGQGVGVPRLRDALAALPGARWSLELKADRPGLEDALARELRAAGAVDRVVTGSGNPRVSDRIARALPEACLFANERALRGFVIRTRLRRGPQLPGAQRVLAAPLRWHGLRVVDRTLVRAADAAGCWVFAWTVNRAADMRALLDAGVHGIISDRPDVLRAVLDEAVSRPAGRT